MRVRVIPAVQVGGDVDGLLEVPDIPELEAAVIGPGGQHPVVIAELDACDWLAELVGLGQLQGHVDEVLPVIPHLDTPVIAHGTAQQTVSGGQGGLSSITEYIRALLSIIEYYRTLWSIMEQYCVLLSIIEHY